MFLRDMPTDRHRCRASEAIGGYVLSTLAIASATLNPGDRVPRQAGDSPEQQAAMVTGESRFIGPVSQSERRRLMPFLNP